MKHCDGCSAKKKENENEEERLEKDRIETRYLNCYCNPLWPFHLSVRAFVGQLCETTNY